MLSLELIKNDPYLAPFEKTITYRYSNTVLKLNEIIKETGSLKDSINGHLYFGLP